MNLIFRTDGKASLFFIKYTLDLHVIAAKLTNDRYDIKGVTGLLGIVFLTNNKQAITFIIQRTFIADNNKAFITHD